MTSSSPEAESKTLKHVNDVCRLDKESSRSESVKGLSLADVIAEKKIAAPPSKIGWGRDKKPVNGCAASSRDDLDLSLDEVIKRRRADKEKQVGEKTDVGQSLEAIIQKKKESSGGGGQKGQEGSLEEDGESRGMNGSGYIKGSPIVPFIATPLDVLLKLTEQGLVIQCEIAKIAEGMVKCRAHTWRAKYTCGDVSVQCDSSRKILAKQGAASQFLTELKAVDTGLDFEIPPFKIPEGCFYDPVLESRLEEVVSSMSLGPARFETVQSRMSNHDYFTTTFYIGDDEFTGSSFDPDYAKILAAKQAYDVYSGKPFPRESYFLGDKCPTDIEYDVRETEATHVITLTSLPTVPESAFGTFNRKRPAVRKADSEDRKMRDPDEGELFVDDSGQMYVRAGAKLRKVSPVTLEDYGDLATDGLRANMATPGMGDGTGGAFDPMSLVAEEEEEVVIGGAIDDDFDYEDL